GVVAARLGQLAEHRERDERAGADRRGVARRRVAELDAAAEQLLGPGVVARGAHAERELEAEVGVRRPELGRLREQRPRVVEAAALATGARAAQGEQRREADAA